MSINPKELAQDLIAVEDGQSSMGVEEALAVAMRGVGQRIAANAVVYRGLVAADQLKPGFTIASDEAAVMVADLVATVIDGEKALAEAVALALRIPKRMEATVRDTVAPAKDALANARQVGNAARVAYQTTIRRQAAEAEAKARQAAQEAARIAADRAAETGEDAPPPAEVAPIEVPRVVSGGQGKMGTMITIAAVEIVDWGEVPKSWMALVPTIAGQAFREALAAKAEGLKRPEPGESIVWRGVRFEARESAVNRR